MTFVAARSFAAFGIVLLLSACAQTSRVDVAESTPQALAAKGTGVAVMRLGTESPGCHHVQMLIGVREGNHYRGVRGVKVANIRSVSESAVAEVELSPGEYHFLAYRCIGSTGRMQTVGAPSSDGPDIFRSSIAKFTLRAGEVVNVGYLHYNAVKTRHSMFGRPIRQEISVSDWPLEEIERFAKNRPEIYARMTTRLMQITIDAPPTESECARLADLKRQGKVSELPSSCVPPARGKA